MLERTLDTLADRGPNLLGTAFAMGKIGDAARGGFRIPEHVRTWLENLAVVDVNTGLRVTAFESDSGVTYPNSRGDSVALEAAVRDRDNAESVLVAASMHFAARQKELAGWGQLRRATAWVDKLLVQIAGREKIEAALGERWAVQSINGDWTSRL
jgi:hypothetical protein